MAWETKFLNVSTYRKCELCNLKPEWCNLSKYKRTHLYHKSEIH